MASYLRDARSGRSGWPIFANIDWHVVVADPVCPRRGSNSLCKIVAHSGCDGVCFHPPGGAANRLRVFGGMSSRPGPFVLSFFILLPPPFRHAMDGVPLK